MVDVVVEAVVVVGCVDVKMRCVARKGWGSVGGSSKQQQWRCPAIFAKTGLTAAVYLYFIMVANSRHFN